MQIEKNPDGTFALDIDEKELAILNNALNEVCNGIQVEEFETRMGSTREDVHLMLRSLGSALRSVAGD